MKLAIFGATGGTGKSLVAQALAAGYEVVAFVRDPSKLTTKHEHLTIVQGDVTDPAAVERAVDGVNAVISVLNTGKDAQSRPITHGTQNILAAMKNMACAGWCFPQPQALAIRTILLTSGSS